MSIRWGKIWDQLLAFVYAEYVPWICLNEDFVQCFPALCIKFVTLYSWCFILELVFKLGIFYFFGHCRWLMINSFNLRFKWNFVFANKYSSFSILSSNNMCSFYFFIIILLHPFLCFRLLLMHCIDRIYWKW